MLTKKPTPLAANEAGTSTTNEKQTPVRPAKKTQNSLFDETASESPAAKNPPRKSGLATQILVKYDVGFHNHLTIRGKGANLSWSKGIPLKNNGPDEWIWESDLPFETLEFKILVNDHHYEHGDNHSIKYGEKVHFTPHF